MALAETALPCDTPPAMLRLLYEFLEIILSLRYEELCGTIL